MDLRTVGVGRVLSFVVLQNTCSDGQLLHTYRLHFILSPALRVLFGAVEVQGPIRILFRCWKTNTPYNESVYLKALKRRGSPLMNQVADTVGA